MPNQARYQPVMPSEDVADGIESNENEFNEMRKSESLPATSERSRSSGNCSFCRCCCGFLSYFLVYLLGFASARIVSLSQHTYSLSCDSISYGFLNTQKGHELVHNLTSALKQSGQVAALSSMQHVIDENIKMSDVCHETLHKLATVTWKQDFVLDKSTPEEQYEALFLEDFIGTPYEERLRLCSAGYMHGILERGMANFALEHDAGSLMDPATDYGGLTPEEDWERIKSHASWIGENICEQFEERDENESLSNRRQCLHGLGHGALQNRRQIYRKREVREALQLCSEAEGVETLPCYNGVWMEYWAQVGMTMDVELDDTSKDPVAICEQAGESEKPCRFWAASSYLIRHPRDYKGAVENFCKYDSPPYSCIQGVGMHAAKQNKDSFIPLEEACLVPSTMAAKNACFYSGVSYIQVNYHTGGVGGAVPAYLCDGLQFFAGVCHQLKADPSSEIFHIGDGS